MLDRMKAFESKFNDTITSIESNAKRSNSFGTELKSIPYIDYGSIEVNGIHANGINNIDEQHNDHKDNAH